MEKYIGEMDTFSPALENVISKLTRMKYDRKEILHAMDYRYIDFTTTDELTRVKMHIEYTTHLLEVVKMYAKKSEIDVFRKSIELMKLELANF